MIFMVQLTVWFTAACLAAALGLLWLVSFGAYRGIRHLRQRRLRRRIKKLEQHSDDLDHRAAAAAAALTPPSEWLISGSREMPVLDPQLHQEHLSRLLEVQDLGAQVCAELIADPIASGVHVGDQGVSVQLDGVRLGRLGYGVGRDLLPGLATVGHPIYARARLAGNAAGNVEMSVWV